MSTTKKDEEDKKLSGGKIAGIVIGSIIGVIVLGTFIYFISRAYTRSQKIQYKKDTYGIGSSKTSYYKPYSSQSIYYKPQSYYINDSPDLPEL